MLVHPKRREKYDRHAKASLDEASGADQFTYLVRVLYLYTCEAFYISWEFDNIPLGWETSSCLWVPTMDSGLFFTMAFVTDQFKPLARSSKSSYLCTKANHIFPCFSVRRSVWSGGTSLHSWGLLKMEPGSVFMMAFGADQSTWSEFRSGPTCIHNFFSAFLQKTLFAWLNLSNDGIWLFLHMAFGADRFKYLVDFPKHCHLY